MTPSHLRSLLLAAALAACAAEPAPRAFLDAHCLGCHGPDVQKGRFRVDTLPAEFAAPEAAARWARVVARLDAGEMPPPDADRPPKGEAAAVARRVKADLAAAARAPAGRTRMRRLNRTEYEHTVRDLLGVETPLKALLPEDPAGGGFDTDADALSVSPVHVQCYLAAAEAALHAAAAHTPKPTPVTRRFHYTDPAEKDFLTHGNNAPVLRTKGGELQIFSETHPGVFAGLRQFGKLTRHDPGVYRVRVSVSAFDAATPRVPFAVRASGPAPNLVGYYDARPGEPQVIEFTRRFGPDETVGVYPYRLGFTRAERGLGYAGNQKVGEVGPALCVQWVEVEGPLAADWPPPGHKALFGDLPLVKFDALAGQYIPRRLYQVGWEYVGGKAVTVARPADPPGHARSLLAAFLPRAFRRPVEADEVAPYVDLVAGRLKENYCFEEAMAFAYRTALCSPDFLFLREGPGPLDDHALACRLSYFLWRSMPDDALRAAADRGELRRPDALRAQAERMLNDPKAHRFVEDFCGQWLGLHQIDATVPDKVLYPEFFEKTYGDDTAVDGLLREAVLAEARLFVADLLRHDRPVADVVAADFTYLNDRLAKFYGVPGVDGVGMRKVALPPGGPRGGVLTMAAVLKVTANGTTTSPVLRGKWVLENVLGRAPPPPPADAGAIEPDTRGATTVREQLAKHQRSETCAACHRHIDPPGFALEAFDPVGRLRTYYRSTRDGEPVVETYNGWERTQYRKGPAVEVGGKLADGRAFAGPAEFKTLLLADPDAVARCLAGKLLAFATGRPAGPCDLAAVDDIAARARAGGHGVRSLVREVILSETFRHK